MSRSILNQFKVRKIFYLPILIVLIFGYTIAAFSSNVNVHYVYKILPVFVIYTDNINKNDEGTTKGPIIFIRKGSNKNNIVLNHELVHAKQCYRYGFFNWLPLLFSDHLLAKMEAEAYTTEISRMEDIPYWASFIKEEYKIDSLSEKQIEVYIRYYWNKQK